MRACQRLACAIECVSGRPAALEKDDIWRRGRQIHGGGIDEACLRPDVLDELKRLADQTVSPLIEPDTDVAIAVFGVAFEEIGIPQNLVRNLRPPQSWEAAAC